MSQPSATNLRSSFQQSWKSCVAKSWRIIPVMLLLAFCLLLGQGVAHASTRTAATASHAHSAAYCNYRTYTLTSTLQLVSNSDGTVYDYEASNMNGRDTVKIWHNNVYMGEYYLTAYDANNQVRIYVGSNGYEYVDACLD